MCHSEELRESDKAKFLLLVTMHEKANQRG